MLNKKSISVLIFSISMITLNLSCTGQIDKPISSINLNGDKYHCFIRNKEIGGYGDAVFLQNTIKLNIEDRNSGKNVNVEYKYSIFNRNGITCIKIGEAESIFFWYPGKGIVAESDDISFWLSKNRLHEDGYVEDYRSKNSTSFLTQGGNEYKAENLGYLYSVWVSGNGNGIGDTLTLTGESITRPFVIVNGFVDIKRPFLYLEKARAKKIKVRNMQTGKEKTIEIEDTWNFQKIEIADISLGNTTGENTLEFTILDVYPGSKSKDLAINALIPDFTED